MSQSPQSKPQQTPNHTSLDEDNTITNRKPNTTTTTSPNTNTNDDVLAPLLTPAKIEGEQSRSNDSPRATKTDVPPTPQPSPNPTTIRQRLQHRADHNGPDGEEMGEGMKLLQTVLVLVLFVVFFEWFMAFWRHAPKSDQQVMDEYLRDNPLCPPGVKCEFWEARDVGRDKDPW